MQNFNSIDQTVWPGAPGQTNTHTDRQTYRHTDRQTHKKGRIPSPHFYFYYKLVLNSGYGDSIFETVLMSYTIY